MGASAERGGSLGCVTSRPSTLAHVVSACGCALGAARNRACDILLVVNLVGQGSGGLGFFPLVLNGLPGGCRQDEMGFDVGMGAQHFEKADAVMATRRS